MLPTDFGPSISEVVAQLWKWLAASCVTVNMNGIIITLCIFISSCG